MEIMRPIMIITMLATLTYANIAMADGERHPGHHRSEVASDCLKPITKRGLMGVGFWQNSCDYGVHVKWRTEGKESGCEFRPESPFPCLAYVPAKSRVTANLSDNDGSGSINWIACRAKDFVSDPWPVITRVLPDKHVRFGCYHMGYAPNNEFGNKEEAEKAVRANWRGVNRSYRKYVVERQRQRQLARQRRLKRDRQRELAQERSYWAAFVYVAGSSPSYSVSWNHSSEKQAFDAVIKKCTETIGIPCWPRREVNGWWLPDHVMTFSTSGNNERIDPRNHVSRVNAKCVVIYTSESRYKKLLAQSKYEADSKFRKQRRADLEYYGYKYPPIKLVETICNKR